MNEADAWNSFLKTGSVVDYLRYKSIQAAKNGTNVLEDKNEVQDERTDNQRTEYR